MEKKIDKAKWANRCDMWIVEQMRYRQTDRLADRPTNGHSQL